MRERRPGSADLISGLALFLFAAFALAPLVELAVLGFGQSEAQSTGQGEASDMASAAAQLFSPRNIRALAFTLEEALCSTAAAFLVGLPGAYFTARFRFPGRRALKASAAFPFGVPSVLVVLAFVLFYGQNGFLNQFLMAVFGLKEPPLTFLYSFWGIVLVHGFYEFPLVLDIVGEALSLIPRDREDAARLLGASGPRAFITGTLPALLPSLAEAAGLCFLLCYFSFAVVMVFGGLSGSTLEVEVYRRARIEADSGGAALLALFETIIALLVVFIINLSEKKAARMRKTGSGGTISKPGPGARIILILYGIFLIIFFIGPIIALIAKSLMVRRGLLGTFHFGLDNYARLFGMGSAAAGAMSEAGGLPASGGILHAVAASSFVKALHDSLVSALPAAALAWAGGAALALCARPRGPAARTLLGLPLAVSSIVASLGWSLIFPRGGLALIVLVEAAAALPFAAKSVLGALEALDRRPAEAARSLGSNGWQAAFKVELRAVAPSLGSAFAFAFAAAFGDVSVPMMLGAGDFDPLPLMLYRLTSSYRLPEACALGVLIGALTSFVFWIKELPSKHAGH